MRIKKEIRIKFYIRKKCWAEMNRDKSKGASKDHPCDESWLFKSILYSEVLLLRLKYIKYKALLTLLISMCITFFVTVYYVYYFFCYLCVLFEIWNESLKISYLVRLSAFCTPHPPEFFLTVKSALTPLSDCQFSPKLHLKPK